MHQGQYKCRWQLRAREIKSTLVRMQSTEPKCVGIERSCRKKGGNRELKWRCELTKFVRTNCGNNNIVSVRAAVHCGSVSSMSCAMRDQLSRL